MFHDPFFGDVLRESLRPRKPEPPQTITVDGVEYVRKEPTLKYKVGARVLIPATVVRVDEDDEDLPYRIRFDDGDEEWYSKKTIEG